MSKNNIGWGSLMAQARAMDNPAVKVLLGKTLTEVIVSEDNDRITFKTADGESYTMLHYQDCCEHVQVEEVIGDLADLIGSPLVEADEVSSEGAPAPEHAESYSWTFYKFGTAKGFVTIRWLGESNGYYSEHVDFCKD